MIQVGSIVKIQDNSGGKTAQCLSLQKKTVGSVGDVITVAIQKALPNYNVKKGEIHKALIIQTKKALQRTDGSSVRHFQNSVILLDNKMNPIGSRLLGVFNLEIREKYHGIFKNSSYSI